MTIALLALLVLASEPTVLVPFSVPEARRFEEWLRQRHPAAGIRVEAQLDPWLDEEQARSSLVLFAYSLTRLEGLQQLGQVQPLEPDTSAFRTVFLQSWVPILVPGGDPLPEELGSYAVLLRDEVQERLRFRSLERSAPESLILGQVALLAEGDSERALDRLRRTVSRTSGVGGAGMPFRPFLSRLPVGAVSLVPLRDVVLARRAGSAVTYRLPAEGLLSLRLGLARTGAASQELVQLMASLQKDPAYSRLCSLLSLEPALPAEGPLADWIERLAPFRRQVSDVSEVVRQGLADALEEQEPMWLAPADRQHWLGRVVDWLLLLATAAFGVFALRFLGRR